MFLNTKLKITKGYNKYHNSQVGIKLLDITSRVVCGMEAHPQGAWDTIKADKNLYTLL